MGTKGLINLCKAREYKQNGHVIRWQDIQNTENVDKKKLAVLDSVNIKEIREQMATIDLSLAMPTEVLAHAKRDPLQTFFSKIKNGGYHFGT